MYNYIQCIFEYGFNGLFYQEIDQLGNVVRMTDLDGNTIDPTGSYGAIVVDSDPPRPSWAN
jgi:hypothetical protein